jgi:hypothetical protein
MEGCGYTECLYLSKTEWHCLQLVVWHCRDEASSVQQFLVVFLWCGPWGVWELSSSKCHCYQPPQMKVHSRLPNILQKNHFQSLSNSPRTNSILGILTIFTGIGSHCIAYRSVLLKRKTTMYEWHLIYI